MFTEKLVPFTMQKIIWDLWKDLLLNMPIVQNTDANKNYLGSCISVIIKIRLVQKWRGKEFAEINYYNAMICRDKFYCCNQDCTLMCRLYSTLSCGTSFITLTACNKIEENFNLKYHIPGVRLFFGIASKPLKAMLKLIHLVQGKLIHFKGQTCSLNLFLEGI